MTTDHASTTNQGISRRNFLKLSLAAGGSLIAAGALNPNIAWASEGGLSRTGVKARLLIGSDLHIQSAIGGTEGRDADKKLEFAMDTIYALDPQLDAFCLVGDVTDNGREDQYQHCMSLINGKHNVGYANGSGKTKVILCQGNHETYTYGVSQAPAVFKEQTGQDANKVVDVNGTTVITLGPSGASDHSYASSYDFLCNALKGLKDPSAPIVLLSHHQIHNTSYTSTEWYGDYGEGTDSDIVALMKQYPNIIHVSGHSHATLEDERSINQDFGFTEIQDSTIGAYYENETGKIDPDTGEGASVPPQTSPAYTDGKNIAEASQCIILDIMEDGTAKVYRVSLVRSKTEGAGTVFLYEPWTIDVPAMVSSHGDTSDTRVYRYTSARQSTKAPAFPSGAAVTVDEVTEGSAKVHFPAATPGSDSNLDMVHEYKITVTPAEGDPLIKRVFSDYYRPQALIRKNWDVLVKGLLPNTSYTVSVAAQTSWSKEAGAEGAGSYPQGTAPAPNSTSDAITSAPFTTAAKKPSPRAVLDIDFRSGKPEDAMGHACEPMGAGSLIDDADVVAGSSLKVYQSAGSGGYRYTLTDADYDAFTTSSTLELMFKTADDIQNEQALFANEESAGAGFEVESGNLEYWYRNADTNSYVTASAPVEANQWTHAIAVADGKTVTLYVNGERRNAVSAGSMVVPAPKFYYVGCDTDGNGNPQFKSAAGTRIAFARVLPYAMTAAQVETAWAAAQLPPAPKRLLDVDFNGASSAGDVADAGGREAVNMLATGALVRDETSGRNVFAADGTSAIGFKMTENDYAYLGNEHALELLFMMGETGSDQCLLSNQQYAGDGLEVSGNAATAGKLALWFNSKDSGRVTPSGNVDTGTWHHAMGTYNGHSACLYIDGELKEEQEALGGLKVPAEQAHVFFLGADTSSAGAPEIVMKKGGKIAFARILSKIPTDDEIAARSKAALESMGTNQGGGNGTGGNGTGGSGTGGSASGGSGTGGSTSGGSGTGGSTSGGSSTGGSSTGGSASSGSGAGGSSTGGSTSGSGTKKNPGTVVKTDNGTGSNQKGSTAVNKRKRGSGILPKTGDVLPLIGSAFAGLGTLAIGIANHLRRHKESEAEDDPFIELPDSFNDDEF